jgi:16S rRNA (uracil1498-N3)-methyltransferase
MNRIFITDKILNGKKIEIQDQKNYLCNVLRLELKSRILVFNGLDGEYLAEINEIKKKHIIIDIIEKIKDQTFLEELNIYFSIIKQDKMMFAIDSAIQLGATSITPIITDYTQYRDINYDKIEKRIIESTEQSGRLDKAFLHKNITLKSFVQNNNNKIIWTNVRENIKTMNNIEIKLFNSILIGPEGGFSDYENELMEQNPNFESIKLSKNILRSELALICSMSQFNLLKI